MTFVNNRLIRNSHLLAELNTSLNSANQDFSFPLNFLNLDDFVQLISFNIVFESDDTIDNMSTFC